MGALAALLSFCGCGEDDYVYPPVLTEILMGGTDATGTVCRLLTDKEVAYRVENLGDHSGLVADTLYRFVATYEITDADEPAAHLYSLVNVFAQKPLAGWEEEIKHDPVDVQSIWLSGDYLNMVLLVKAQDKKHIFRFIETVTGPVVEVELYHDKGEDVEAYTQRAYLSLPLKDYKQHCSGVRFTLNTSKEGMKSYSFSFQ